MTVCTLSIAKLLAEWGCNPFDCTVWDIETPITRDEVQACIADGSYQQARDPYESIHPMAHADRIYHVRRVAYLVVHGWTDPIDVDLGIPCVAYTPSWPIQDGNHRFAAAIFRGDPNILADAAGQTDWIARFKPHDIDLSPPPEGTNAVTRFTTLGPTTPAYVVRRDAVELAALKTPSRLRRRGHGRYAITTFLAAADAQGLPVTLLASPGDKKTSLGRLVRFYMSLGFTLTGRAGNPLGHPIMVRPAPPPA